MVLKSRQAFFLIALLNFLAMAEKDDFFNDPALSAGEKSLLIEENIKKSKWVRRYCIKQLDAGAFYSARFQLNLFGDLSENVDIQKKVDLQKHFILIGKTGGTFFNNVKIIVNKQTNYVSGTAIVKDKSYRFWTLPNGMCVIAEIIHPEDEVFADYYFKG